MKDPKLEGAARKKYRKSRTLEVQVEGAAYLLRAVCERGQLDAFASAIKNESRLLTLLPEGGELTMKINRKTFRSIEKFVKSTPELSGDPTIAALWQCDPNDPYDICWKKVV